MLRRCYFSAQGVSQHMEPLHHLWTFCNLWFSHSLEFVDCIFHSFLCEGWTACLYIGKVCLKWETCQTQLKAALVSTDSKWQNSDSVNKNKSVQTSQSSSCLMCYLLFSTSMCPLAPVLLWYMWLTLWSADEPLIPEGHKIISFLWKTISGRWDQYK